jgi:hypothetical protein
MSAKTLQIANALGAKIVGHVPDAGPGSFGVPVCNPVSANGPADRPSRPGTAGPKSR